MPKYKVFVTSDATMSGEAVIESATDRDDAIEQALQKARDGEVEWFLNEGNEVEPYLGDEENDCEEVVADDE